MAGDGTVAGDGRETATEGEMHPGRRYAEQ